ncbi:MAG: asparagine synthetase B [candidate division KSB1 bacterium]|nr:asparagine synthetase B [candidate division KSB1 bacterium]MDZ7274342.1 asparagine synthetase B [candidate division KSB1 bacterium]MDZ7284996.1 asparagine synthetase B [candidate division KSB1 bacterium]MDZ7297583.1 asparagine synthetase B [candidate division KSB1 bacterium]MDZ7308842.1 asparagine synthetase B [candidate division KSB1 bacterium]
MRILPAVVCSLLLFWPPVHAQKTLIPMDLQQTDHLKAYGIAYWALDRGINVEWLLNYRGGSFMLDQYSEVERECRVRGVTFESISGSQAAQIYAEIEGANMEVVLLEKAPAIAIYTPPNKQVWDDAVTLALDYAEIPFTTLWDEEVLAGKLEEYDWLHLHHEDFSGQYGRFYASYHNAAWYKEEVIKNEAMARKLGFAKVAELKKAVARAIKEYAVRGGFLFAMCSATDTIDLALAAQNTDICAAIFDYDPPSPNCQQELDYSQTLAFTDFHLEMNPMVYEFSDIDYPPSFNPALRSAEADFFTLFEFSAKYDPVPTMLTQNHVSVVKGFMGQTTGFRRDLLKKQVTILADVPGTPQVKYLHGNIGRGTFTFYGGHDPEDYQHMVYDPPTQLSLHKNSPGYRLILNNILFPAAKKKKRKT